MPLAALIGAGLVGSHQAARAASFDCTKGAAVRERLVCADPELSKLDSEVGRLYRRALAQLSLESAQRLREGERGWLAYLKNACPLSPGAVASESKSCLRWAYAERVSDLKLAAVRVGPYLFSRVDTYSATAPLPGDSDDPSNQDRSPALRHVAFPQIDQPSDAVTRQWNSLTARANPAADCQDVTLDYRIGLATPRLISVTWNFGEYCHGTPHPLGWNKVENTILPPEPRPLRPGDLFRQDGPWKAILTALLRAAVERKARDYGISDLSHLNAKAIVDAAASPKRWSLKQDGLEVAFDPYELGEGYPFAPKVTVPWPALKAVLAGPPA